MDLSQARKIFGGLSITQICDVAPHVRLLDSAIKPFTHKPKMLGKALTINADGDLMPMIQGLQMATDDHVIMVNSGNSPFAMAGEIFTSEARRKKIAGIVIDGFCRDAPAIHQVGVPFYARGTCLKAGSKTKLGEFNGTISCGGVSISPNDIILGDEEGVVAIALEELAEILRLATDINNKESFLLGKINSGTSIPELSNFSEHYQKISVGEKSSFHWK